MRRWIVAAIALVVWCAVPDFHGPAASGDSRLTGAAFCASYPDTSASDASFNNVVACSGPGYTGSIAFDGDLTQAEVPVARGGSWQCTEYASRYFTVVTGRAAPLSASGAGWVAHAHRALPQYGLGGGAGTGAFAPSIVPGVIISMWGGPAADPLGHVAVVTDVSVTHGNGTITVVGENAAGYTNIHVVNGTMTYGSSTDLNGFHFYTTFQWLTGLPGGNAGAPFANGALIRTPNGNVYVIAGGAPLHLGTCAYTTFHSCATAFEVADLSGYMPVPVDGTVLHDAATDATYIVAGGAPLRLGTCSFTQGGDCGSAVTVDGYAIATLDHLRAVPADGTLLHDAATGDMYVVAGGAPLRLGSCAYTSGGYCAAAVTVDDFPIATLDHLRPVPADGTVLREGETGRMYIVAGGAPLRLRSCSYTPGGFCATAVTVDDYPIVARDHMRPVPVNGTVLRDVTSEAFYVVIGGAPLRLSSCSSTPGGYCGTAVTVDDYPVAALDRSS